MNNYKYAILIVLGLLFSSCTLEETPPFLANDNVYSTANNASTALNGLYNGMVSYFYYGNEFIFNTSIGSGFGVTKRGGNTNTNAFNASTASLNPLSGSLQINNIWKGAYLVIGRANDVIQSAKVSENPGTSEQLVINDVIGQAYFVRAFNYFNLVRLWGEVPLRIYPTTKETVALAKSPVKEIYAQIISDVKIAQKLMNGSVGKGTPKPEAAAMLLSKVYMTLATASSSQQEPGLNYWQLAYDEAKKVYGRYTLMANYGDLFKEKTSDNTVESIFELQSSVGASLDHARSFTVTGYTVLSTYGWLKVNAEVYDLHAATYPGDPRISATYISSFTLQTTGKIETDYPTIATRSSFANGFPYLYKLGSHDVGNTSAETTKNFAIYRYADLLLMLAEISNELNNGEQLGYVKMVLDRAGLIPQPEYRGDQASFRKAIMKEYQFELLFEGQDWFTNRRRGYDYFLNNIIIPHNTYAKFKAGVDVTLITDKAAVMYFPFPDSEINANPAIGH